MRRQTQRASAVEGPPLPLGCGRCPTDFAIAGEIAVEEAAVPLKRPLRATSTESVIVVMLRGPTMPLRSQSAPSTYW